MSRSKILLPEDKPLFYTTIPVQITNLNYGGHVGNDKMLSIIHEARVRFLVHNECTELDIKGAALIMAESLVLYKNEAFYGDPLTIKIWATDITSLSFDLIYQITTSREGKEITIALAKTVMISFDYQTRKTKAIPVSFLEVLQQKLAN